MTRPLGLALLLALAACAPHPRGPAAVAGLDPAMATRLAGNPDDVEARLALAEARRAAGDLDGALVEASKAIASDPHSKAAQVERARIYFDAGIPSKEVEAWKAAVEIDPADSETRESLGHALLAAGKLDEASAEYRKVLAVRPGAKSALFNLAQLSADAGRLEEARDAWTRYLALDPEGKWADRARKSLAALPPQKAGP